MSRKDTIDIFTKNKKRLILLQINDKKPLNKGWRTSYTKIQDLYDYKDYNLGWALGKNDLVIDIDPRNNGLNGYSDLVMYLLEKSINHKPFVVTVKTPSDGFHIYLKIPPKYYHKKLHKKLSKYPGVDFLTEGSQCVVPSSKIGEKYYSWADPETKFHQDEAPDSLIELLIKGCIHKEVYNPATQCLYTDFADSIIVKGFDTEKEEKKDVYSYEDIVQLLSQLDPSMPHDIWLSVGMALHYWDQNRGIELWEEWSKKGSNYVVGDTIKRWESFHNKGGVTVGTLIYLVKKSQYEREATALRKLQKSIAKANQLELESEILNSIAKTEFSHTAVEILINNIKNRYQQLEIPIQSKEFIRDQINEKRILKIPDWCKRWLFINSHNTYFDLATFQFRRHESFNIINGKFINNNNKKTKTKATKFVSDNGFIEVVDKLAYLPNQPELIVKIGNLSILNIFDRKTLPKALPISKDGQKVIDLINAHLKFICGSEKNTKILTEWVAHQVQYLGQKILWAPLIQGIQGIGKSFIGQLLRSVLGYNNVGTVSTTQINSQFNGWATNVCVNILDELKVSGVGRHEVVNALKPLITDPIIQINEKGVKPYTVQNTTNYICFTNHKDAVPLSVDDRRWWIVFAPIDDISKFETFTGVSHSEYFYSLFTGLESYVGEIKTWLLEYPISKQFFTLKRAPLTYEKQSIISMQMDNIDGLPEIMAVLEKGGFGFNKDIISSSDIFKVIEKENPDLSFTNYKKNSLLKLLGYQKYPKRIFIKGELKRIWSKKEVTSKEIRILFKIKEEE